ncbi:Germination-specific N-acetylmuramoyl-L-alanine amidase precursor [compost metagenome]
MPAALLEIGFLSNATEESLLFTEEFQQRVAASIVEGIVEYLTLPTETAPIVQQQL